MKRKAFIDDTIDNYSLSVSQEYISAYEKAKATHKLCQRWNEKFNACNSYEQLLKTASSYKKSKIASVVDVTFFFYQYIFADVGNVDRFNIIMEYMSSGAYPAHKMINALCSLYNPDDVMQAFKYSSGTKTIINRRKKKLKEYICSLKNGEIEFQSRGYFDKVTQYYCEETSGYKDNEHFPIANIYRYFETFNDFVNYRGGNLKYCDLSGALECNSDFSGFIVDETTNFQSNQIQSQFIRYRNIIAIKNSM